MGRQFKDQILWLGRVWESWNEAERVVAIYSVARSLSPTATKFLLSVLSQNVPSDNVDVAAAEARANDPTWIAHIPDSYDGGTQDLLQHLPLLRPSNNDAKAHYLTVIPKVLSQILSQPAAQPTMLEKARQLLSYSLIHPALSATERKSLSSWIQSLEEKLLYNEAFNGSYDPTTEEADEGGGIRLRGECIDKCSRLDENALPICTSSPSTEEKGFKKWEGAVTPDNQQLKEDVRWSFIDSQQSPNHCGASPRSSGSESVPEEPFNSSLHPGMKGVGAWLKSLRLHKYASILCSLTYEELLALTEEILESKGVTKGARHKIVISIAKLRTRDQQLELIEKEIMEGRSIQTALNQLKSIITTPMLPSPDPNNFSDHGHMLPQNQNIVAGSDNRPESFTDASSTAESTDIPSRFTRVMGKVCTQLLVSARYEDECVNTFLALVEKGLDHESFNETQKKKFLFWKHQVFKIWHPMPPKGKEAWHNRRWSQQYTGDPLNSNLRSWRFTQQRHSAVSTVPVVSLLGGAVGGNKAVQQHLQPSPSHFFSSQQPSLSTLMNPRTTSYGGLSSSALLSPQHFFAKRPSLQEPATEPHRPHVTLQRTKSAPSRPNQVLSINQSIRNLQAKPDYPRCPNSPAENPNFLAPTEVLIESQMALSQELDPDMTTRLESLCLSMTEHALG